jgi:MraZ protein
VEQSGGKWVKLMFMGEYNHTIDTKGRIIVPAKFREMLGEEFVVTLGLDGCLFVYPNEEWLTFVNELKALPGSKEARQLQRYFMAGAATCEVDKQGRILIPAKLREQTALEKDIVFVGVLSKIEIWSKERWENNNNYENMDEIAEHMSGLGLSF